MRALPIIRRSQSAPPRASNIARDSVGRPVWVGQPLVRSSLILCMRGVVAGVCEWLEISQSDPMLERRVRQRRADVPGTMSVEIVIEALDTYEQCS